MGIPFEVQQALKRLKVSINSTTTKEEIQQAYRERAQTYHPDSHHPLRCPTQFRECHDARRILLEYYGKQGNRSKHQQQYSWRSGGAGAGRPSASRYESGFPTKKLRILTVRQNLTLRATIMTVLTVGTLYQDYSTKKNRRGVNIIK